MGSSKIPHLLFTILLCIPLYNTLTTKSISLTPANPSQNGVRTKLIKGATNYAPFEFDLYAIDESSLNMQLLFDKSWSFDNEYTTTLTIKIGSDTPINSILTTSLLISFSQNNTKYITSVIEIGNNNDDILIYPPSIDGKQIYGEGNIRKLIESKIYNTDRISKATNNGSYGYFTPYISTPNISYPLTFILENHPDFDYMIFTYFTPFIKPRNIIYYGMNINNTLDIYLSAANKGDNFDITYFNITHSIHGIINKNNNNILPTNINLQTTLKPSLKSENINTNTDWFESALVIILVSTIVIMCCLFFVFGIMFFKIFRNHTGLKIIEITSPKNPMKNEKPLQVMPKDNINNLPNMSSLRMAPSFTSITNTNSKSIATNPTLTTPTLNDILAVLGTKSTSLNDLYEYKQDEVNINDIDMNIIYNEVMRRSIDSINNNKNTNRKISNTNTNTNGQILYEMDEKNSADELEGSDDSDLELECMYNAPNNDDIRRATVPIFNTPGNNINNNIGMIDKLAIDENVNRISIIQKLSSLKLQLQDMISGDSEALYEQGNDEGTPYGSTDTQNGNTGGITPYSPENIHMCNV